ncbi:MAG: hypothetical protein KatS3mg077_2222 [Candidatus Binatia bacterium]|nr:MAG: hypothetical protein KatS3mg077_2222 [Candidatus Binatia bacterium]
MILVTSHAWASEAHTTEAKIYVVLGFHANFYHSWRGDTPDEAGFGTDIRVVRGILDILERAREQGIHVRASWDFDNLFTLESILPRYAPDIIARVRSRVAGGLDEVIVAPYNNGMFSAMTAEEMRAVVRWAVRNPWGSGVADVFGAHTPVLRPQEYMFTTGTIPLLRQEGIQGVVLAYSNYPFTAFSNFVPALPVEQRFHPLWLQTEPNGPRILLLPAVSIGDVLNFGSFELWLLRLRQWQQSQAEPPDLLLYMNFDADADTWLPMPLPRLLRWLPNTRGLEEYIEVVHRYEWAVFTTLGDFSRTHAPRGQVLVRQDMADGAWDGQYSWAEKFPSQQLWTQLEQSRLAERRAMALSRHIDERARAHVEALLFEGRDSAFFERLRALSTTHFGMSTPLVNEERQAVAEGIAARTRDRALEALRSAAHALRRHRTTRSGCDYQLLVQDCRTSGGTADTTVRIPLWWPQRAEHVAVSSDGGQAWTAAWFSEELADGSVAGEVWVRLSLAPLEQHRLCVHFGGARGSEEPPDAPAPTNTEAVSGGNSASAGAAPALRPAWDAAGRLVSLRLGDHELASSEFIDPFITYRVTTGLKRFHAAWEDAGEDARADHRSVVRRQSRATISLPVEGETALAAITVTWTAFARAPWLVADVDVAYSYTPKRDVLHGIQQKLRRYLDLRWVEVAPFPIAPNLTGTRQRPLRVWKHNWLGVTSVYDLDYAHINAANAPLDSFNHQVTAGWVAVSDGRKGLLVAQSADAWSSPAFTPMRLREQNGEQRLWINPFGSYHGKQMSYAHLGGSGIAQEIAERKGAQFRPNGPSFNGQRQRFRLLLAAYEGDEPPPALQDTAAAFFYPPAVVYLDSPARAEVLLPEDMRAWIERRATQSPQPSLPAGAPRAFLVNPTQGAAHLVWDPPASGNDFSYEVEWRAVQESNWQQRAVRATRASIEGLVDGQEYEFRVRAVSQAGTRGEWSAIERARIGAVPATGFGAEAKTLEFGLLVRAFYHSTRAALTAWWLRLTTQ